MAINVNPGDPHYPGGGDSLFEEKAVKDQPSYRNRPKPMTNGVTIQQEQFRDVPKMVTNADRIRAMSDEELASWFADMWDCNYCSEHEWLGDYPLLSDEPCDQKCKEHCLEWLQQPAEEVDHE